MGKNYHFPDQKSNSAAKDESKPITMIITVNIVMLRCIDERNFRERFFLTNGLILESTS